MLKGEYKVISGKMCDLVRHPVSRSQLIVLFFDKISNDLEWDGESKRIIAVGDGKEKCVNFLIRCGGIANTIFFMVE